MSLEPGQLCKVSSSARKSFDSLPLKTRSRQAFCGASTDDLQGERAPLLGFTTTNRQSVTGIRESPFFVGEQKTNIAV
jgi:hypothetical protein